MTQTMSGGANSPKPDKPFLALVLASESAGILSVVSVVKDPLQSQVVEDLLLDFTFFHSLDC